MYYTTLYVNDNKLNDNVTLNIHYTTLYINDNRLNDNATLYIN